MQSVEFFSYYNDNQWQSTTATQSSQMGELGPIGIDDLTGYQMSANYSNQCMGLSAAMMAEQCPTPAAGHYINNPHAEYVSLNAVYPSSNNNNGYNISYSNSPEAGIAHSVQMRPYLTILEQPGNKIRFRYQSERGSHGGMFGRNNTQQKKTHPTIQLHNYDCTQSVSIRASLCTDAEPRVEHVHKLQGKNCNDQGVCTVPLGEDGTFSFQGLGISFTAKKEVKDILLKRLKEHAAASGVYDESQLNETAEKQCRTMQTNMNTVRICFEAFYADTNELIDRIYSEPVNNQKSAEAGELKITRLSRCSGYCRGDDEVFLLCEKVNKKDIKVRFFNDDINWEAYATFADSDVHHQVAIVFKTPPYFNQELDKPEIVYLQLFRPKDGEMSDKKEFIYRPNEQDPQQLERKRKRLNDFESFSDNLGQNPPGNYPNLPPGPGRMDPGNNYSGNIYGQGQTGSPSYHRRRSSLVSRGGESSSSSIEDTLNPNTSPTCLLRTAIEETLGDLLEPRIGDPAFSMDSIVDRTRQLTLSDDKTSETKPLETLATVAKTSLEENKVASARKLTPPSKSLLDLFDNLGHYVQVFAKTGDPRAFLSPMRHLLAKPDKNGDNALHLAVIHQSDNERLFQQLLYAHNSIENPDYLAINYTNNEFQTPLHLAVFNGKPSLVSLLLMNGAKPEIQDRQGQTAVHLAVLKKQPEILAILLNKQSYSEGGFVFDSQILNIRNFDGNTALHLAVETKQESFVSKLVDAGADVNYGDGTSGRTPLHLAVELYHEMVPCLLKQIQIDVNGQDYAGNTALHAACDQNKIELAWQLMELEANPLIENFVQSDIQGASAEPSDVRGVTPHDIAAGNTELLNVLAGVISPSLKRKISQARRLSAQESSAATSYATTSISGGVSASRFSEPSSSPNQHQLKDEKLSRLVMAPTDSGYASGKVEEVISEELICKLCEVLDPPCTDWEKLCKILIEESHIDNFRKLHSSPTRAIIKMMEKRDDFNMETLRITLEAADLPDALRILNTH